MSDLPRLERLLGGDALRLLRMRLRARYEQGRDAQTFTLQRLAAHEREALVRILGRRAGVASSLRVDLTELDDVLRRAGLASSLRHALELLDGPLIDRAMERAEGERRWSAAYACAAEPRLQELTASAAGRSLIKRLAGSPDRAAELMRQASLLLARLPARGIPRSQLAAQVVGDAHALDRSEPLGTIALAVLRSEQDERDRHTWARVGVLVNEFAKPVLTLNIPAAADTPAGKLLASARESAEPVHLSLRALLRDPPTLRVRGLDIYVCENANLLAVAADRLGARCAPLVCTDGMPAACQRTLLGQLAAGGASLLYHGDFDWPGLAIGNFVMRRFGARAWRFDADHYTLALRGRRLAGIPVDACWDARLAPTMLKGGYVLEEEAVADTLLEDLTI